MLLILILTGQFPQSKNIFFLVGDVVTHMGDHDIGAVNMGDIYIGSNET